MQRQVEPEQPSHHNYPASAYLDCLCAAFDEARFGPLSNRDPVSALHLKEGDVKIALIPHPVKPECGLANIDTKVRSRGKGFASASLEEVTRLADQFGIALTLQAIPHINSPLGHPELRTWYEKHGFEFCSGQFKDMIREPRQPG